MDRIAILYAVKVGAADWQEEIVTTADPMDVDKLTRARTWAEGEGYDRFRVAIDDGSPPNFAAAVGA